VLNSAIEYLIDLPSGLWRDGSELGSCTEDEGCAKAFLVMAGLLANRRDDWAEGPGKMIYATAHLNTGLGGGGGRKARACT
jgi:hypothetical protein